MRSLLRTVFTAVAALVIVAPAAAAGTAAGARGIYEWEFGGYYPTEAECHAAADREADTHRCYPPDRHAGWALYNGHYT
ncbi:hypothetical protein ALI144C_03525 [Actinosynnema sp. ALI-1.44]|uniref:hypothetical protein n=1 Tax=Actinosynnema sp. ALI-1.44 TaxID=1933779 RepID=UPI00097BC517|nr:hypothetical protein [Actinosynnema sp. ALI-1.44]ONI90105.1 hypothetical protein ALI144C_03525 [Actinosynnema sp. ALI-1.44]